MVANVALHDVKLQLGHGFAAANTALVTESSVVLNAS